MFKSLNRWRLVGGIPVAFAATIAIALTGGASTGHAAPGITFTFEPLIGTTSLSEIPKVSFGRGIGFHLFVKNDGTNSTPQTSSIILTNADATYDSSAVMFNGATLTCVASTDLHQLTCSLPTGTLKPGDTFDGFFRFIAPAAADIAPRTRVFTTATLTVAAKTVGGKKNQGTSLSSTTLPTDLVSDAAIDNAFLRGNHETASTGNANTLSSGHPQNFSLTTPAALLNGAFGVAVGIQDKIETAADPCVGLLTACTTLTIPAAHFVSPLTPFGVTAPYTWSMNAVYTGGFNLHGVVHVDDSPGAPEHPLPSCASLNSTAVPTVAEPLCYDTLTQDSSNKLLGATGKGLENGGVGFN